MRRALRPLPRAWRRLRGAYERRRRWRRPPARVETARVVLRPRRAARIHLGCGETHLPQYLNVDLPLAENVPGRRRPDVEADIVTLGCAHGLLSEIRLHHLFEHFERAEALALLVRWYDWLMPEGILCIETPDFERCIDLYREATFEQQTLILRHIFGSQEAAWASHRDGWSAARFAFVLEGLGYEDVSASKGLSDASGLMPNVTVTARRPAEGRSREQRLDIARELLRNAMNGPAASEHALLSIWSRRFDELAVSDS